MMNVLELEPLQGVMEGFATVFAFLRKLYILLYNAFAGIVGNPTKKY